jgi:integrase/recombinase XerD
VKFYDKELKQLRRSLADLSAPIDDVSKIQTSHIEQFIEQQQEVGRAINTINSRLRSARTFFNFCLRKKWITANPMEGIQQLKIRHEVGATFPRRQLSV